MILHVFNQPLAAVPEFVASNDGVLLIADGVYSKLANTHSLFALHADLEARGIDAGPGQQVISYDEFVSLCTQFEKVVSW